MTKLRLLAVRDTGDVPTLEVITFLFVIVLKYFKNS